LNGRKVKDLKDLIRGEVLRVNRDKIKMPGGGLPGVGRFTMGGKHNESWCKSKTVLFKCQVIFLESLKIILKGS
jgi:hypothetical protein